MTNMKNSRKLLYGKTLFLAAIPTLIIVTLLVYLTGLESHRSIIDNSLISSTIIATTFFTFITIGLYNGLNVIDNYSNKLKLTWKNAKRSVKENEFAGNIDFPSMEADNIFGAIVLFFFVALAIIFLIAFIVPFLWVSIVFLTVAIYWIMIRSLKLIFSRSRYCENNLLKSLGYALLYTALYTGWIYGVIYLSTIAPNFI